MTIVDARIRLSYTPFEYGTATNTIVPYIAHK